MNSDQIEVSTVIKAGKDKIAMAFAVAVILTTISIRGAGGGEGQGSREEVRELLRQLEGDDYRERVKAEARLKEMPSELDELIREESRGRIVSVEGREALERVEAVRAKLVMHREWLAQQEGYARREQKLLMQGYARNSGGVDRDDKKVEAFFEELARASHVGWDGSTRLRLRKYCDQLEKHPDVLVQFQRSRVLRSLEGEGLERFENVVKAAVAMEGKDYGVYCSYFVALSHADALRNLERGRSKEGLRETEKLAELATKLLPALAKEMGGTFDGLEQTLEWHWRLLEKTLDNPRDELDLFVTRVNEIVPGGHVGDLLLAHRNVDASVGWNPDDLARLDPGAMGVDRTWRKAVESSREAARKKRLYFPIVAEMVEMAETNEESEEYLERSIALKPRDAAPHWRRARWLAIHDSLDAGMDYLRKVARDHAESDLALLLIRAHVDRSDGRKGTAAGYFSEEGVWEEVETVYAGYFKANPNDYLRRSQFVAIAMDAERWLRARELLEELGGDIDVRAFGGQQRFDYLKRKMKRETKQD